MRLSDTLTLTDGGMVACGHCEHELGAATANWKAAARLHDRPMSELGGPYTTGAEVVLRTFCCPGCGVLIDTEIARAGDPPLEDRITAGSPAAARGGGSKR